MNEIYNGNPQLTANIKKLKKKLKDRTWRLNNLYYIKDVNNKKIKFKMTPEQKEYYENEHNNNIILKARQLGFTTLVCIMQLDAALFENKQCALIAHTLHDAKRLFNDKVLFAYNNLPTIIKNINPLPTGDTSADQIRFTRGGSVIVSTSFRSGTAQRLHVSEFGKICAKFPEKAREIITGALPAVPSNGVVTFESTAEGRSGYFFDYCMKAQKNVGRDINQQEFKFFFFSWWRDPKYALEGYNTVVISKELETYFKELEFAYGIKLTHQQKAWYAIQQGKYGTDIFREYPSVADEAFKAIIEGAYYAKIIMGLYQNKQISNDHPDNPDYPVNTYWDFGVGDSTAIWFVKKIGEKYHIIDFYQQNNVGLDHYLKVLKDKGYNYGKHYAPHDVAKRELGSTGAKSLQQLAAEGYLIDGEIYTINFIKIPQSRNIKADFELVRRILPKCYFNQKECEEGLVCLETYHQKRNSAGEWLDEPEHDWTSHAADAFRYFAVAETSIKPATKLAKGKIKLWGER